MGMNRSGLIIVAFLTVGCDAADTNTVRAERLNEFRTMSNNLKSLHKAKTKPKPGEWLSRHDESGQTFVEYAASKPNRPDEQRTTLYIQPIGEFDKTREKLVADTADLMSRFYGLPTKIRKPLGLDVIPESARRVHPSWGDRQILTTHVLNKILKPNRPKDAVAVLALTTSDLWPGEGWNFVFGQASLRERVGVWSMYRYGDPQRSEADLKIFQRRLFKVALHETGHMFGIKHCTAFECGMNGSNHREEMDSQPVWFCSECAPKVCWACRRDAPKRFASLAEFAEEHQLDDEANFWRKCLKVVQNNNQP